MKLKISELENMCKTILKRKLAACIQISNIESFYIWINKIENIDEFKIIIKTTLDKYSDLEKAIVDIHSYEIPTLYALDIYKIYQPYSDWITKSLQ